MPTRMPRKNCDKHSYQRAVGCPICRNLVMRKAAIKLVRAHKDYFEWGHTPGGHEDLKKADKEMLKVLRLKDAHDVPPPEKEPTE